MGKRYLLSLLLALLFAFPSHAQQPETVNEKAAKYHGILKKRPGSGYLFDRFYNAWLDTGSLAGLEDFLTAENAGPGRTTADALILGFYHAKQGNDRRALDTLAQALETDPEFPAGWLEKAKISARNLNYQSAISDLDRALEANPTDDQKIEIVQFKGRLLVRSGKNEDALALWKQLLSENPGDEELHEDLVELQIDEGLFEEAIDSLRALIAKTRDPYQRVLRQLRVGDVYQRIRRRQEALAAYEAALRQTGRDTWIEKEIMAQIEQVFRREDDLTGLARYLETLASAEGRLRPALVQRHTRVLLELKETGKAIRLFQELLARTPGNKELRKAYIDLLGTAEEAEKAVIQMEVLIKQNPDDDESLMALAKLQHEANQTEQALSTLETYLSKAGDEEYAWLQAARLQETFGRFPEAESTYRTLIATNPSNISNRETFAAFLHRTGKREEAINLWKELAASGEPDRVLRSARALISRRENESAFEMLKRRYEDLRNDSVYLAKLCQIAILLKKHEEATGWAVRRVQLVDQPVDMAPAAREAATILIQAGKAEEVAEKLAAKKPKSDQDRCLLAELLERDYKYERADEVLEGDSKLLKAQRIRMLKLRGDWKAAAEASRELLLAGSGRRDAANLRKLVTLYRRANLPEEARKWLPEWKALSPGSTAPWLIEVTLAEDEGDDEAALETLESAARKFAGDVTIRSQLARGYQRLGRNADAQRIYTRLYDEAEDLPGKLRWIPLVASAAREGGKIELLIEAFKERRRNNRGSIAPLLALAEIHRTNYDYTERRKVLMEASQLRSRDVDLILEIARIEEREGNWQDALESLQRARKLEDSPRVIRQIGAILFKHGTEEESYRFFDELGSDADAGSFVTYAHAIAERHDWQKLKQFLSTRVVQFPDHYRIHYLNAIALEELSEHEAAAESYLRVLAIDRELPANSPANLPGPQTPPSYGKSPPGLELYLSFINEAWSAYLYRRGEALRLPFGHQAHGAALAHLSKLKRLLDEDVSDGIDRKIRAIAGNDAVLLSNIRCEGSGHNFSYSISEELLARNQDNPALYAFWLTKLDKKYSALGWGFETYQACFDLFKDQYLNYAILTVLSAARKYPDRSKPMLGEVLSLIRNARSDLSLTMVGELFERREELSLNREQKQILEGKMADLYFPWTKKNPDRTYENLLSLHRVTEILANERDPARCVDFLEKTIMNFRRSNRPTRPRLYREVFVNSNLLLPVAFPPPELNRFPKNLTDMILWQASGRLISGMVPTSKEYESLYQTATDPVLRLLIACRLGKDDATLETLIGEIEASPLVDPIARAQLLASWHNRSGNFAEVVTHLEKVRRLPMTGELRKQMDVAIVTAAKELDMQDEHVAPLVRAGRAAVLRLSTGQLRAGQRQEVIGAMRALGMESAAEREEKDNTSVASMTPINRLMQFSYMPHEAGSRERIARLIQSGKKEAAVREYAVRMRALMPHLFNAHASADREGAHAAGITRQAEKDGLSTDILQHFQNEASKSDVRQLEYAGAAILFGEEETAIEQLEHMVDKYPGNAPVKTKLAILLIKRGEDAGKIRELLDSLDRDDFSRFAHALNQVIPFDSVPVEIELSLYETVLPYIKDYVNSAASWQGWVVAFTKRLIGPWKGADFSFRPLYRDELQGKEEPPGPEEAECNALRWKLHDRFVEEIWKAPDLSDLAFECEYAGALTRGWEYDPVPGARKTLLAFKDIRIPGQVVQSSLHPIPLPGPAEVLVRDAFLQGDRTLIDKNLVNEIRGGKYSSTLIQHVKNLSEIYFCDHESLPEEMRNCFPYSIRVVWDQTYGFTIQRPYPPLLQRVAEAKKLPLETNIDYVLKRAEQKQEVGYYLMRQDFAFESPIARKFYLESEAHFLDYISRLADIYCRPLAERNPSKKEGQEGMFTDFLDSIAERYPDMRLTVSAASRRENLTTKD